MMPASAPAAPVRVEIPPLPSAAPVRMEMPPLAPAAPVRMEMPPLQAAPQRAPCPRRRSGASRLRAASGAAAAAMPQQHAAPQPPATPPAYRAAPTTGRATRGRPPVAPCAQPAPQPPAAPMPQAPRPPRAHGAHARCADAAGTGVAAGDLARRHGRRPAERDQRLARRAGKPHGRPALGRTPGARPRAGRRALFRSLLDAGFSTKLVRTLVERMPEGLDADAALAWARNELVTHLPVLGSEDTFLSGGVYALVGPTGVGKTTTLAKLAARCVAREGRPGRHADDGQFPDRRAGAVADLRPPHGRAHAFGARRRRAASPAGRAGQPQDRADRHHRHQPARSPRGRAGRDAVRRRQDGAPPAGAQRRQPGRHAGRGGARLPQWRGRGRGRLHHHQAGRSFAPGRGAGHGHPPPPADPLHVGRPEGARAPGAGAPRRVDRPRLRHGGARSRALHPSEADLASLWSSARNPGRRPGAA